jgi:hypothetical protein
VDRYSGGRIALLQFAISAVHIHKCLKRYRAVFEGGRRPKTPMETPGQVQGLKIVKEGPGWIDLRWRKPWDGGCTTSSP